MEGGRSENGLVILSGSELLRLLGTWEGLGNKVRDCRTFSSGWCHRKGSARRGRVFRVPGGEKVLPIRRGGKGHRVGEGGHEV